MRHLKIENLNILASSPLEDKINTHVSNVLYLLEMDLTLCLMMMGLLFFIIYVFSIRIYLEKHINNNFSFILKFPYGKTLHTFLNKVFTYSKFSGNIWFYFMFFSLLISLVSSTYCIHTCILILKMIPS